MNTGQPPTVLVIEDDNEVLEIIRAHLTRAGYRVLVATGGENGLDLARTQAVDLITLDLLMSPMGGQDVLHQLRADASTRGIPVVLVTVVDELSEDTAAEGYVSKPFLKRRLLAEVRRLIPPSRDPQAKEPATCPSQAPRKGDESGEESGEVSGSGAD